ncbi:tRNA (cytidine(34)-2'-O)-methyltransferase [Candidatus Sumerlaeota bacterium]|nr:tRNA (cytidine(34)-2'-O)-methyltransferase [Candidatus Sumerlaeota bacterium]
MPPAIVLIQPGIPQNVGAVGRLCAATKSTLHVVRPIPFELSDRSLKRAGMDYLELLDLQIHLGWKEFKSSAGPRPLWFLSSHATRSLYDADFRSDDMLIFGNESAGLPDHIRVEMADRALRIPMPESQARCLNLATSAAIALYEVLRKTNQV